MKYSKFVVGRGHGRTQNGMSISHLKSSVQKYIRRGETGKAIGCLYEINTLILLENAGQNETELFRKENKQKTLTQKSLNKFGKAQRTNIANRLLVITSEEINIHDDACIPLHIWRLYNKWMKARKDPKSVCI